MDNPNSAIERVKNHLAYKLGQTVIEHRHNGGGYLTLFKKLYKIKKQHQKEKQIYQETIKVFPQLKYPNLETCPDYDQALRYKFHLSYMLGEVLIKADKTWHKGGGFKLKNNIKKVNKEFQIFREMFKTYKIFLNIETLPSISDNKSFFLKRLPRIENILNQHQNYQAILDNIFHNFTYFMQNFDLIEEWLLSDDFDERYKKEKHPYPSLLNPKKLNDENEKINYNNIPAELAWEMNLPLPDNYNFIFLVIHGAGTTAMTYYLRLCSIEMNRHYGDPIYQYLDSYKRLLIKTSYNVLVLAGRDYGMKKEIKKFYSLIAKEVPALCVLRDPISILKPIVNHFGVFDSKQIKDDIEIFRDIKFLFNIKIPYCHIDKDGSISLEVLREFSKEYDNYNILNNRIIKNIITIFYITMDEIKANNAFSTLKKMSKIFNFQEPKDEDIYAILNFTNSANDFLDYYFFPKTFFIIQNGNKVLFILEKESNKGDEFYNCIKYFTDIKMFHDKRVGVYLKNVDFLKLKNSADWDKICKYFKDFFIKLEDFYIHERGKLKTERDILYFLKENKDIAFAFKNKFDEDYMHVKQTRPDIVASWKYYQEFEKMCKELDGDI
ncbi:DUF2972 domain-containing protein [Campylobacter jejuni]|uniref:DUF2972 domain-containing protein n=1 Tax=Campylobacter jejuni TaxID=197 RepID=UPI002DB88F08|nr:DUF2972 domain-containing protein [Campylobacter jejuni]ECL1867813.1 DUF2972 domain-containing protein [Campylobacter jejuni]MEC4214190.1 DUF2972 domain-containing protein [Campylobacter jejuni]